MSTGIAIRKLQAPVICDSRDTTPTLFPEGEVNSEVFRDFDEMSHAARNWDQDYAQLGRGAFCGRIRQAHTALMQVGVESWSPGILVQGQAPRGAVVFAIQSAGRERCYWRGAQIKKQEIIAISRGQELDFHANSHCELVVVAFDEQLFAEHARVLWDRPLEPGQDLGRTLKAAPADVLSMVRHWHAMGSLIPGLSETLCDARFARRLETDAMEALLTAASPPAPEATHADRRRVAIQARSYMLRALDEPPTIKEICESVGTTERTLHLGFREAFGMTPKNFMKILRLNAVRNALQRAGSEATVTQVAFRWGFFHLARFAADYRRMFGELPSQTLRK